MAARPLQCPSIQSWRLLEPGAGQRLIESAAAHRCTCPGTSLLLELRLELVLRVVEANCGARVCGTGATCHGSRKRRAPQGGAELLAAMQPISVTKSPQQSTITYPGSKSVRAVRTAASRLAGSGHRGRPLPWQSTYEKLVEILFEEHLSRLTRSLLVILSGMCPQNAPSTPIAAAPRATQGPWMKRSRQPTSASAEAAVPQRDR